MKKLEALFDAVIVKPIENEETLYGNIIVPDMGKEKNEYGEVIAVGFGRYTLTGVMIPMTLKVGDLVVLPTQGFTKLPFDGEEYYVGPENQVLAKVQQTIEGVLTETELTEDDKTNLTDI
jgi:chaperonin GroES|tara:strand:+ start:888 stop:1247 length:360 start_codon:yes stop_codon:yes gene_type:complete